MALTSLLDLPVELLCDILSRLRINDLLQCCLINRRTRKVITESSALQFTIELARYRMVPTTCATSFASRLRELRDQENAWRDLSWKAGGRLRLAHSGAVYEFAGGLYAVGKEMNPRDTDVTLTSISFHDLINLRAGGQADWEHKISDLVIVDFTMDPAQDLLVIVALSPSDLYLYDLHLRTLSSNEPHPLAPSPVLHCCRNSDVIQLSDFAVRIQISGDVVGFLIKELVGGHFEVYKWQTASPNSCHVVRESGIDDFTFLSQDHFLLVRPCGMFEVYSFTDPISQQHNPSLRACYCFPGLSDKYRFWYINLSSNPSPGYKPSQQENKSYYSSPEERIHACCVYVFQPVVTDRDNLYSFVFFFHAKALLNPPPEWREESTKPKRVGGLYTHAHCHLELSSPTYVPWEVWGPQSTRWFCERLSKDWQHSFYGLRTVECVPNNSSLEERYMADTLLHIDDSPEAVIGPDVSDDEDDDYNLPRNGSGSGHVYMSSAHQPDSQILLRYLRVRDYNPYAIARALEQSASASDSSASVPDGDDHIEQKPKLRVVIKPSKINTEGVFKEDIISHLPYVETLTQQMFSVSEVMMDDSNILLLKRGRNGKLKTIKVLRVMD